MSTPKPGQSVWRDQMADTPVGRMTAAQWRDLQPDDKPPSPPTLEQAITASVDAAVSNAVRRHLERTDAIGTAVYEAVEAFLVSPVGRDTVADAVERAMRVQCNE